jgi:deazaflavin-dependent oxidoreductase (nitroreductase family)
MNFARSAQRALVATHIRLYEMTDGAIGGSFGGLPCLLLGTIGAKTGQARTTPLGYANFGDEFILVASNGGNDADPYWFRNIELHPEVTVRVGKERIAGTATILMPGERHYDQRFSLINAEFGGRYYRYQEHTTRPLPIVVVTRVPAEVLAH